MENKETLEEAAKRLHPISMLYDNYSRYRDEYDCNLDRRNAFIEGAKWQAERSYSEEEVLELLKKIYRDNEFNGTIKEWFEQFKKK